MWTSGRNQYLAYCSRRVKIRMPLVGSFSKVNWWGNTIRNQRVAPSQGLSLITQYKRCWFWIHHLSTKSMRTLILVINRNNFIMIYYDKTKLDSGQNEISLCFKINPNTILASVCTSPKFHCIPVKHKRDCCYLLLFLWFAFKVYRMRMKKELVLQVQDFNFLHFTLVHSFI